jgi:hypothetical protein
MNDRSLKAREIEALTFIYPARARPPAAQQARWTLRPWRITVGVAGLVLLGALAWFLLPA